MANHYLHLDARYGSDEKPFPLVHERVQFQLHLHITNGGRYCGGPQWTRMLVETTGRHQRDTLDLARGPIYEELDYKITLRAPQYRIDLH